LHNAETERRVAAGLDGDCISHAQAKAMKLCTKITDLSPIFEYETESVVYQRTVTAAPLALNKRSTIEYTVLYRSLMDADPNSQKASASIAHDTDRLKSNGDSLIGVSTAPSQTMMSERAKHGSQTHSHHI